MDIITYSDQPRERENFWCSLVEKVRESTQIDILAPIPTREKEKHAKCLDFGAAFQLSVSSCLSKSEHIHSPLYFEISRKSVLLSLIFFSSSLRFLSRQGDEDYLDTRFLSIQGNPFHIRSSFTGICIGCWHTYIHTYAILTFYPEANNSLLGSQRTPQQAHKHTNKKRNVDLVGTINVIDWTTGVQWLYASEFAVGDFVRSTTVHWRRLARHETLST